MSHPCVMIRETSSAVHIMIDGGPDAICDLCCKDCNQEPIGYRFGTYVVCGECATKCISEDEDLPDETSRPDETFKTFCDRLNAPLRAQMDKLAAEAN